MDKGNVTKARPGAEFFRQPQTAAQRQYEALRAYLLEGRSATDVAERLGYAPTTLYALARELRAGRLRFFEPLRPGPKKAPKREAARQRVIELRKQHYSVYDIQAVLRAEECTLSHVLIHQILREEGFAKLPRRREDERPTVIRPEVADVADVRQLDWEDLQNFETEGTALFVLLPQLVEWGLDRWVRQAGLPGSQMIPALQSVLSMLALKLVGTERLSHVMDACFDPGFALFAGINVLPKTTAISTYSYRVTREMTASLLENYTKTLKRLKLTPGQSFNLDFHAIPHRGEEAVLEKHYVSKRSRREQAVLAFLAQDNDYANATVRKDRAAEEILEFVEFWERTRGTPPPHLVFDSQLTTYAVLERLNTRGILFITLRRRGPALMRWLKELPAAAWKKVRLHGVSRRYRSVRYTETSVALRGLSQPLRQIAVCDLGHEEPTLFLTNDTDIKPVDLVERYAHRMLIENSIAENVDFFHLDALNSAIAIQVDLDLMLTLVANGLYRQLARQLKGFEAAQPKQIFRRFLNTPARVSVSRHDVHVSIRRCAHHPLLLASGCLEATPRVPWWAGRRLHLEIR
jgi:transposase-like protein